MIVGPHALGLMASLHGDAGGDWTPADIATALWLDADDDTTITIDVGVATWADKSGNGRDATKSTDSEQPSVTAAGLNGLDVITFDGSDDNMEIASTINSDNVSIFFVTKPNAVSSRQHFIRQGESTWSYILRVESDGTYLSGFRYSDGTDTLLYSSAITAAAHVFSQTYDGSEHVAVLDGTVYNTTAKTEVLAKPSREIRLGANPSDPETDLLDGDIAEIVMLDSAADEALRQKVEGYLAHRWGLEGNLPAGHPYKSDPP